MTPQPSTSHSSAPGSPALSELIEIMARLRGPDGCPWDREQTPDSLKPYLLEETYEVLEAIDQKDPVSLREELGDLLLQIVFHTQIASEHNQFSFEDVTRHLSQKLIKRHPHVFERQGHEHHLTTSQEVVQQWDQLKQQDQRHGDGPSSILKGIPKTAPALQRAYQVQKRASRVGFDWKTIEPVLEKLQEEFQELHQALSQAHEQHTPGEHASGGNDEQSAIEEELGDVLFSLVNVSRFLHSNPEEALRKATNKFIDRFQWVESQAQSMGKSLQDFSTKELDDLWETAKTQINRNTSHRAERTDQGE